MLSAKKEGEKTCLKCVYRFVSESGSSNKENIFVTKAYVRVIRN